MSQTPKLDALKIALKNMGAAKARVGWFDSAKYESGVPVAYVATIQEYGWGPIPPRPYIRPTVVEKRTAWATTGAKMAKRALTANMPPRAALEAVAEAARGDIAKAISAITEPALAEATLQARRAHNLTSEKPLVASGLLLATLTTQVTDK